MLYNASILVTGGTGSWGYELVKQLLTYKPKKIIVFSRNENSQVNMKKKLSDPKLHFCIGDIRDKKSLSHALTDVDYVFHLAALKHVPICEMQPLEALKTNVTGTQNVIEASIENGVKKVINVSTDKAADPANFYGMTKALGEKLMTYANLINTNTKFFCVRSGNVLGTNGSVLHIFKDRIKSQQDIHLTDKRMTRYFMNPTKTMELLLKATRIGVGGEIFVMNSPACRIIDLAEVLIDKYKNEVNIVECGSRPGEKLYEVLISNNEVEHTVAYSKDLFIVLPTIQIPELETSYSKLPPIQRKDYHSQSDVMTKKEINNMLIEGNFI